VQLPPELREAIEEAAGAWRPSDLAVAAAEIHNSYLESGRAAMPSGRHAAAYCATRMPATYAAAVHVLREVRLAAPEAAVDSLLDLGAGPGTMLWATGTVFDTLQRATLFEPDRCMRETGQDLARRAPLPARWEALALEASPAWRQHALVALSYVLGELDEARASAALERAWQAASAVLVVIEPGTPAAFARLRHWREQLVSWGAHLLAPCPHAGPCPMQAGDWCHFAQRVERTALHRYLKGGALGHEDEKFCYIAAGRVPGRPAAARILRHPLHEPGRIRLALCTPEGLRPRDAIKRHKDEYRLARKAHWGGRWDYFTQRNPI
jgi:ribosomal protein RSM22 (predicted rRNA methylase)